MSDGSKKANDLMRKASEAFAGGKMQKAYKLYGQAATAYVLDGSGPWERLALAYYTRAMFILSGDATGNVEEDLNAGDHLVQEREFHGRGRFRGLFLHARARWRRQHDDVDEAKVILAETRKVLDEHGESFDLLELDREEARLAVDRQEWQEAEEAAQRSVDKSPSAKQGLESRILLSEVYRAQGRMAEVLQALETAASAAFDTEMKDELWDLQDRISILKRNHPELDANQ